MKIFKSDETGMVQGENKWHKWREGKFTSTKVKALFGFVEKTKADYIEEAKEIGLDLPTKTVHAGKPKERIDIDVSLDEVKLLVAGKRGADFTNRKFKLKDENLEYLSSDVLPQIIYDTIAHSLSNGQAPTDETPIERGHRLEPVIRDYVNETYGYNFVEVGGLERDDEKRIANSPDGVEFSTSEIIGVSFEAKAFSGGKHVKAYFTGKYPDEHFPQVLQYFCVNDDLNKLVFVMGCPEITEFPYLKFEISREEIEDEIKDSLKQQKLALAIADRLTKKIQF